MERNCGRVSWKGHGESRESLLYATQTKGRITGSSGDKTAISEKGKFGFCRRRIILLYLYVTFSLKSIAMVSAVAHGLRDVYHRIRSVDGSQLKGADVNAEEERRTALRKAAGRGHGAVISYIC